MNLSEQDKDSIVKTLTSQPSQNDLVQALRLFKPSSRAATSVTASVIFALVNTTIPELWRSLQSNSQRSREAITLLVSCLSSLSGVNALLMRVDQVHARIQHLAADNEKSQLEDILDVLTLILEGDGFIPSTVIRGNTENGTKGKMLLNEYISLVGGSKLLNVVSKVSVDLDEEERTWMSDGKKYSNWLGKKLGVAIKEYPEVPEVSTLLGRALSIGYSYAVIEGLFPHLLQDLRVLGSVLARLRKTSLLVFTKHLLHYLSSTYLNYTISRDTARWWDGDRSRVGAVAGVLFQLYNQDKLSDILVEVVQAGAIDTLPIQRACTLAISKFEGGKLNSMVNYLLAQWGDKLFINHTPVMAQEGRTQLLLLSLAHTSSSGLKEIASSPIYNEGLSNRLAASINQVRFLGMIVGESISRKLDPEDRRLKFKVPDTESSAAESWRSLIDIDDQIHPLKDLQGGIIEETTETPASDEPEMVPADEFLVDDDEDLDEDLKTYPAPESDAEDSDDDPTLVNREKTPNPLYIRDLMKYLQANDYTKVNVGLKTAPHLIRQKASFGTELSDQAHELARILVGLQDTFEMEQFQELRHAALIALVASSPEVVTSYLISVYFTGDLSIQQRLVLLSALGIGARELAGHEKIEPIPQQLLPPSLHRQYLSPMDHLSQKLEATMIEPIRQAAVQKVSGPQVLQVRRFTTVPTSRKVKSNINRLSKIAGREFVFPLLGRWYIHQQDYGGRGVLFDPILLSSLIRAVGIIIQASAPSALDLREMTKEYWDVLLSMRNVGNDPAITESILFGMLVILEVTEPRTAAENFPKQVIETQAWAADLFQALEEGKTKMLAGGILLKCKEIVTKHERLLLGDIISFGSISSAPLGLNLR